MQPEPKLAEFSDGKLALLPLSSIKTRLGLTKTYYSSPAGTFGGWISSDELESTHADQLTQFFSRRLGNYVWCLNPTTPTNGISTRSRPRKT